MTLSARYVHNNSRLEDQYGYTTAGVRLSGEERRSTIRDASVEVRRAGQVGEILIIAAYLPIVLLAGIEGKMFRPMALTVIFALSGALALSLTLIPALSAVLQITIDRDAIARYGINVADVQRLIQSAVAGTEATRVLEGFRRFDLVVRLIPEVRQNAQVRLRLPARTASAGFQLR